jgi:hypothetical protein
MSGALIFILVLVAALIITLYMVYKKGGSSPAPAPAPAPSSGGGPSIDVQGIERTLNPDKKEGYAIREYSTGTDDYDLNELSKNVSMTLQWKNKGGFENVEKIIAKWHHNTSNIPITREFIKTNPDNNDTITNYFTNFTDNTVTLTADGSFNAVGTNIIRLYYVLAGTIDEVELTPPVGTDFQEWTITIPDLSGTIGMVEPTTYTWTPSRGGMKIEKDMFTKQYRMWPFAGYNATLKIEDQTRAWETNNNKHTVSMVPVEGVNNRVKFILYNHDGIKLPGYVYTNKDISQGSSYGFGELRKGYTGDGEESIYEIIEGSKPDHYRFKQNIDGVDYFLVLKKHVTDATNDRFKMMKIEDMTDSCTYNSMDIFMAPMTATHRTVDTTTIPDRRTTTHDHCRPT